MRRVPWAIFGVAVVSLCAGLAIALRTTSDTEVLPLESADAALTSQWNDLDGQPRSLSQYKGRLLVLNFWATWCAPCVEEMPDLQRVQDEFAARGVAVVGLGIDAVPAMRRFRDEHKLSLTLLAAANGGSELARKLGNLSGALPFTVLIDEQGLIAQRRLGRITAEELRLWLDSRLGKKPR